MRRLARLLVALVLAIPSLVNAQPPPVVVSDDLGRREDPTCDRGVLAPTALTLPRGSLAISSYEIFLAGLTYAPFDLVQVTANVALPTLWPPYENDRPLFLLGLKWQALRVWRLRLALMGGVDGTDDDTPERAAVSPRLGAVLSFCLRADCHSLLTLGAHALWGWVESSRQQDLLTSYALLLRLTDRWKLLAEFAATGIGQARQPSPTNRLHEGGDFGWLALGLRLHGRDKALDLGVIAIATGTGGTMLPFGSGTLRF